MKKMIAAVFTAMLTLGIWGSAAQVTGSSCRGESILCFRNDYGGRDGSID